MRDEPKLLAASDSILSVIIGEGRGAKTSQIPRAGRPKAYDQGFSIRPRFGQAERGLAKWFDPNSREFASDSATDRIHREKEDAVSQLDICERTGLAKSTVSGCVRRLGYEKGLLDVQPDAWGSFDRIYLSPSGERLLTSLRVEIDDRLPMRLEASR